MTAIKIPWWVYASVALSGVLSLISLSYRFRAEERNHAVTIVAEAETIKQLAASQGESLDAAFDYLQAKGLGGAVVSERNFADLIEAGLIRFTPGPATGIADPHMTFIEAPGGDAKAFIPWIALRFPNSIAEIGDANATKWLIQGVSAMQLRSVSAGVDPTTCRFLTTRNMLVIARFANPEGLSAQGVEGLITHARRVGASVFLPMGDQVLGRRDNLGTLVDSLRANSILYATPEFAKIGGDLNVTKMAPEIVVRLHSAQAAELDKMSFEDAVERYSRAASERNQRILLLRPLSFSAPRPLDAFGEFLKAVREQVEKEGLDIGRAHPFEEPGVPSWLFPMIGLAAAPALFFAVSPFLSGSLLTGIAGLIALALGVGAAKDSVKPFTALACAVAFPIVAYLVAVANPKRRVLASYVLMSLISLAGGLCVAGLLNSLPYLIKANQFVGVKVAHFAPVALIGGYLLFRYTNARQAFRSPITWAHGVIAIAILAAIGFMFLRTGNDNPAAVSDIELQMRALLDQVLLVRPRTKEFLVGHPALIVGLALLWVSHSKSVRNPDSENSRSLVGGKLAGWAVLALTLGAIGQTSIVNTLCHTHTPLAVGLTRIGVGLVLGGILGGLLWAFLRRFAARTEG